MSCTKPQKGTITENRTLYVFEFDSLKRTEDYKLTIEIRDTITKYKYENLTDETKNMNVIYMPRTKTLKFAMWDYIPRKDNDFEVPSLSEIKFLNYEMEEPVMDGTDPIFFNPKYGILGIGNVMAPNFVYLKKQSDSKFLDIVIDKLTE